mmetsp:Transcript_35278/g.89090  ORF Transcript_35278/g.89090 Transcript_35278/m.89090 type:complete len:204 (+) Transcript_35278:768-1379(+)
MALKRSSARPLARFMCQMSRVATNLSNFSLVAKVMVELWTTLRSLPVRVYTVSVTGFGAWISSGLPSSLPTSSSATAFPARSGVPPSATVTWRSAASTPPSFAANLTFAASLTASMSKSGHPGGYMSLVALLRVPSAATSRTQQVEGVVLSALNDNPRPTPMSGATPRPRAATPEPLLLPTLRTKTLLPTTQPSHPKASTPRL